MLAHELAERLTIAEAHGELWALLVQHHVDVWQELEEGLVVISPKPVACTAALAAELELLSQCSLCRPLYNG